MQSRKIFVIAEAGVNHNGSLRIAKKLVDAAVYCRADAVKFQAFKASEFVVPEAPKADYQKKSKPEETQQQMLKRYELSEVDFKVLRCYCKIKKIMFLATPFDYHSLELLNRINVGLFKVSSGDLNNLPFLSVMARYRKPIILSTGMSNMNEIKEALDVIYAAGNKKVTLLHCTSNYPAGYQYVNLRAMVTLKEHFGLPVGYSDHTLGIEVAIAAAALEASVIEKHLTLNKRMDGPDHQASLEPQEFKRMVEAIRNIEKAMGNGLKRVQKTEIETQLIARKSIVAAKRILKDTIIDLSSLAIKRPGNGLSPKYLCRLVGKKAKVNIEKNSLIKWEDTYEN